MKRIMLAIGALCLSLTGVIPVVHAQTKCGSGSKIAGAAIGGVLGGLLGNKIDGGRKRTTGTLIGALGGAVIGSMIAAKLDDCEKEKMAEATIEAVNASPSEETYNWSSDSRDDVRGTVVAAAPVELDDGRQCRTVTRVAYISGEEVRETPRLCRTPPGKDWQVS